jgi:TPR repeat protein
MAKTLAELQNEITTQNSLPAYQQLRDCIIFRVDADGKPVNSNFSFSEILNSLHVHAREGHAMSQALLASFYLYGIRELNTDVSKALEFAKRSAGLGEAAGETLLGFMYYNGHGVSRDPERAQYWFKMAEAKNYPYALNNIGMILEDANHGKPDFTGAFKYYRAAAEQGNSYGLYNVGRCYEKGIGVSQDYAAALNWYKHSAEKGNIFAQYNLATMLEKGIGTEPNLTEAVKWYLLAGRLEREELNYIKENIDRLRKAGHSELIDKIKQELQL